MKSTQTRLIAAAGLALLFTGLGTKVLGYPTGYGPFPPEHEPAAITLDECKLAYEIKPAGNEINGAIRRYRLTAAEPSRKQIELVLRGITNGWEINLRDAQDRNLMPASFTNRMTTSQMEVFSGDLNGDGEPDFIVNVWSGGCGLAADGSEVTFLLSSKDGYRATSFYLYAFGHKDLVRFKPAGPVYFIFNDLISSDGEKTRDGRAHNFWVYDLLRIDGNRFVPANAERPGFPKWIWFTNRDNHTETTQLSQAQKNRLLMKRNQRVTNGHEF